MSKVEIRVVKNTRFQNRIKELRARSPYPIYKWLWGLFGKYLSCILMRWLLGENNKVKNELFKLADEYVQLHPFPLSCSDIADIYYRKIYNPENWFVWFFPDFYPEPELDLTYGKGVLKYDSNSDQVYITTGEYIEKTKGVMTFVQGEVLIASFFKRNLVTNSKFVLSVMETRKKKHRRYVEQRLVEGLSKVLNEDVIILIKQFL
jgi:hypothetical protein